YLNIILSSIPKTYFLVSKKPTLALLILIVLKSVLACTLFFQSFNELPPHFWASSSPFSEAGCKGKHFFQTCKKNFTNFQKTFLCRFPVRGPQSVRRKAGAKVRTFFEFANFFLSFFSIKIAHKPHYADYVGNSKTKKICQKSLG
ncbi:MAG: hypothetical protein IJT26_04935, partial [Bacteroidales bacterium]|nr:hypothetical protein [Bacteroidales bacterium]